MANMQFSAETNLGFSVWWDGNLETGSTIYFSKNGDAPHTAQVFRPEDEMKAQELYNALDKMRHPNVCDFLRPFKITHNGENLDILAFDTRGKRLDRALAEWPRSCFANSIWLTDTYRNLLVDLLNVIKCFLPLEVAVDLDPKNIFLLGGHVMVSRFSSINSESIPIMEYKKVATLITFIGTRTKVGKLRDAEQLRMGLESPKPSYLADLCTLPVFWSATQKIHFPRVMWDLVENGCYPLCSAGGKSPFAKSLDKVAADPFLGPWFSQMSVANKRQKWVTKHVKMQVSYLANKNEIEARECLAFTRKGVAHFVENTYPKMGVRLVPGKDEVEFAQRCEDFFPNYIWFLYEVALRFQNLYNGSGGYRIQLLPVQNLLTDPCPP